MLFLLSVSTGRSEQSYEHRSKVLRALVPLCRPAAQWMLAADAAQRHDQSHLVSHHIQMPLPALATLLSQVPHIISYVNYL